MRNSPSAFFPTTRFLLKAWSAGGNASRECTGLAQPVQPDRSTKASNDLASPRYYGIFRINMVAGFFDKHLNPSATPLPSPGK